MLARGSLSLPVGKALTPSSLREEGLVGIAYSPQVEPEAEFKAVVAKSKGLVSSPFCDSPAWALCRGSQP